MGDVMVSKTAVFVALAVIASAMLLPGMDADVSDSEVFTYYAQLDVNGKLVYKEVNAATSVESETKEFIIDFNDSSLFDDTDGAKAYADKTVREALTALYLSNPMVPYVWDYPVVETTVDAEIILVTVKHGEVETTYYAVDNVKFSLKVPEGITSDSMKELNDALKNFPVSGSTDADKVKSIMSELDKVYFEKDEEGKISNIYSALVLKKTTSAGVAQAFTVLCKMNNIPAVTVSGSDLLATNETFSYWNYVYLEGDIDGETAKAWYIVDPTYAVSTGIAGYLTEVSYDGKTYSMSSAHNEDLDITGEVSLKTPQLAKNKYVPVGGIPFFEVYGEAILIVAIGVVMIGSMFYAMRKGII